jgi:hypothetical protein
MIRVGSTHCKSYRDPPALTAVSVSPPRRRHASGFPSKAALAAGHRRRAPAESSPSRPAGLGASTHAVPSAGVGQASRLGADDSESVTLAQARDQAPHAMIMMARARAHAAAAMMNRDLAQWNAGPGPPRVRLRLGLSS